MLAVLFCGLSTPFLVVGGVGSVRSSLSAVESDFLLKTLKSVKMHVGIKRYHYVFVFALWLIQV
jgi:hypothetical protein